MNVFIRQHFTAGHDVVFLSHRAMTLVELLVVISIISLLAVTVLPNIAGTIDSRRAKEASRGLSTFIARSQARAINAAEPCGFQIQPLPNDTDVALDFFLADVPETYAGEFTTSTVQLDMLAADSAELDFSDSDTGSRVASNEFTDGDGIQFRGYGPYFRLTPTNPPRVTMWSSKNQSPYNTLLPPAGVNLPFRIRRQPARISSGVHQLTNGTAVDLRWSMVGGVLFPAIITTPAPITILFDTAGRPTQLVHSGGVRSTVSGPILLLIGFAELCGNDPIAVSQAESYAEPETRNGANWQYVDSTWLLIDAQSGVVSTFPVEARAANQKFTETSDPLLAVQSSF